MVLNDWWDEIDYEKQKFLPIVKFSELLKSKGIISKESELKIMLKKIIPGETI